MMVWVEGYTSSGAELKNNKMVHRFAVEGVSVQITQVIPSCVFSLNGFLVV